jgi:hypothetical protein
MKAGAKNVIWLYVKIGKKLVLDKCEWIKKWNKKDCTIMCWKSVLWGLT